jgi:hypothetical protein
MKLQSVLISSHTRLKQSCAVVQSDVRNIGPYETTGPNSLGRLDRILRYRRSSMLEKSIVELAVSKARRRVMMPTTESSESDS